MTQTLIRERRDNVELVTLNRDKDNRLSGPFVADLRGMLADLAADAGVRAVVVTGNDKFFSNGLDLDWMKTQGPRELFGFLLSISELLKDTAMFPKPLVGAISGHAFGMGAIWASGFDLRLVREDRGWVCFPEMDINIPFSPGMIAICEHGLGKPVFRQMAFSAQRYAGTQAVSVGWASDAVPGDDLVNVALEKAAFLGKKGPDAFRLTKQFWARRIVEVIDAEDADAYKQIPLKL
jgi:enoyl-CoA hydratase